MSTTPKPLDALSQVVDQMRAAEEQHEAERMKLAHRIQQLETELAGAQDACRVLDEENASLNRRLAEVNDLRAVVDHLDHQIRRFSEVAFNDPRLEVAEQRRLLEVDRAELMAVHGDPALWDRSPLLRAGRLAYALAKGKDAEKIAYLRDTGWRESGSGWYAPGTSPSEFMPLPMAFQRAALDDLAMFDRMGVREQVTPQRQADRIAAGSQENIYSDPVLFNLAVNMASEKEAIRDGLRGEEEMRTSLAPNPAMESTTFSGDLTSFSTSNPAPRRTVEIRTPSVVPNEKYEPAADKVLAMAKPVRRASLVHQSPAEQRKLEEERGKKLRHDPKLSVKATLIRSDEDLKDLPDSAFEG